MTALLTTTTVTGDPGHADLHNAQSDRINKLHAEQIFIPATHFQIVAGTPALSSAPVTNGVSWPAWKLAADSTDILSATILTPWGWSTAKAEVLHSNVTTATGNVVWQLRNFPERKAGGSTNTGEIPAASVTVPATAQAVLGVAQVAASVTLSADPDATDRGYFNVSIRRIGADAADTLTPSVAFLGLTLTRLT